MKLSDNLKKIRKENNLSQEQLAEKLGVSRQAVSKWESGQSYPEMDKVLLICKLFNYNIDELMNENVKEVDEVKQGKLNINKYIDDFFAFITKTTDMLSSMNLRQKLYVLSEQIIICVFLICIFAILGGIGSSIVSGLIGGLSDTIYTRVNNVLEAIYLGLALIIGIIILLHIFKIRYLDYYDIVRTNKNKENNCVDCNDNQNDAGQGISDEDKKIILEKKSEKVIIRDPNHSKSWFLTGIVNIVIWFIKIMAIWFTFILALSFIFLVALLILSFLFVKTGLLFVGTLLGIISVLIINFITLILFYHFIINKKSNKHRMAISLVSALLLCGIGIGFITIGFMSFNFVDDNEVNKKIGDVYEITMTDNLSINSWYNHIEYIEKDIENVQIIAQHSKLYYTDFIIDENGVVSIWFEEDNVNYMEVIREIIKDINNKKIRNYSNPTVYVYASKNNIDIIKHNMEIKRENIDYTKSLEEQVSSLTEKIYENDYLIETLNNQLAEKEAELELLKKELYNAR